MAYLLDVISINMILKICSCGWGLVHHVPECLSTSCLMVNYPMTDTWHIFSFIKRNDLWHRPVLRSWKNVIHFSIHLKPFFLTIFPSSLPQSCVGKCFCVENSTRPLFSKLRRVGFDTTTMSIKSLFRTF